MGFVGGGGNIAIVTALPLLNFGFVSLWNDLSDLCLMVWDWRVSRAEPMLSCWHDLLFLFWLLLFYLFLPSMGCCVGLGSLD